MRVYKIISDNSTGLQTIANQILYLADSFHDVGNDIVAAKLRKAGESIYELSDEMFKAYNDEFNTRTNQSIHNSQSFITSILKGVMEGKEPKDACIEAMPKQFDTTIIDAFENKET